MGTDGSPGSLASILELQSVGGPNPTSERIDVTHLGSAGSYREFKASFKDGGQITLAGSLLPAFLTTVVTAFDDQVERDFTITFPLTGGNKVASFGGVIESYNVNAAVGEKISNGATIKISGAIVWT